MASNAALRTLLRGCQRQPQKPHVNDDHPSVNDDNWKRQLKATDEEGKEADDDDDNDGKDNETLNNNKLPTHLDFFQTNSLPPQYQQQTARLQPKNRTTTTDEEANDNHNELCNLFTNEQLRKGIKKLGLEKPTPIQNKTVPAILNEKDVIAIAPTGSGKTLAYLLPVLQQLLSLSDVKHSKHHTLILAPTRELIMQISRVLSHLIQLCNLKKIIRTQLIISNSSITSSLASTNNDNGKIGSATGAHILLATPQTLCSVLNQHLINLKHISLKNIVLDEADELLSSKFIQQIDEIFAHCGISSTSTSTDTDTVTTVASTNNMNNIKIHLFSATLSQYIQNLLSTIQTAPTRTIISAGAYGGTAAISDLSASIDQQFKFVGDTHNNEQGKIIEIRKLIRQGDCQPPMLIFIQSKDRANQLFKELLYDGFLIDTIHSDRTPQVRNNIIQSFRTGKIWILVATDLMARGLDFSFIHTVINYDVPVSVEHYVHRIGRCGRNGKHGKAITFFTEHDQFIIAKLAKLAKASGSKHIPEWLLNVRDTSGNGGANKNWKHKKNQLVKHVPKRHRIGGPNRASLKSNSNKRKRQQQEDDGEDGNGKDGESKGNEQQQKQQSVDSEKKKKKKKKKQKSVKEIQQQD